MADVNDAGKLCSSTSNICRSGKICDIATGICNPCRYACTLENEKQFSAEDCKEHCKDFLTEPISTTVSMRPGDTYETKEPDISDNFPMVVITLSVIAFSLLVIIVTVLIVYCCQTKKKLRMNTQYDSQSSDREDFIKPRSSIYPNSATNSAYSVQNNEDFETNPGLDSKQAFDPEVGLIPMHHECTESNKYYSSWNERDKDMTSRDMNVNDVSAILAGEADENEANETTAMLAKKVPHTVQTDELLDLKATDQTKVQDSNEPSPKHLSVSQNMPLLSNDDIHTEENKEECGEKEQTEFLLKSADKETDDVTELISANQSASHTRSVLTSEQQQIVLGCIDLKDSCPPESVDDTDLKQTSQTEDRTSLKTSSPSNNHSCSRFQQPMDERTSDKASTPVRSCVGVPAIYPYNSYDSLDMPYPDPEVIRRLQQVRDNPNRRTFDIIKKFQWVEGFSSEGHSIDVYVNFAKMAQADALAELVHATGELPTKFNVRSNILV